jgi:hypothetical protein
MTYYDLDMNSKRINNCQDPSSTQDVATKNYVDALTPTSLSATTFGSGILTVNFASKSVGIFTATLNANMTGISFSNGVTGGQYVIYVTASGGTRTIASTLSGTTNRTNYTASGAVSVATTATGIITITFDGTRYLIATSSYS